MVDLKELSDDELEKLQEQFKRISQRYAKISDQVDEVAKIIENEQVNKAKE